MVLVAYWLKILFSDGSNHSPLTLIAYAEPTFLNKLIDNAMVLTLSDLNLFKEIKKKELKT